MDSIHVRSDAVISRLHKYDTKTMKIRRGMVRKGLSSTIPTKYQTYFIENSDKYGFLSKSKRFSDEKVYKTEINVKTKIVPVIANTSEIEIDQAVKKENGCNNTAAFKLPIATNKRKDKHFTPSPSKYHVNKLGENDLMKKLKSSFFSSKTIRNSLNYGNNFTKISPCYYNINDTVDRNKFLSCFNSSTKRIVFKSIYNNPAPNYYYPNKKMALQKLKYPFIKQHYLCLSAPAMPLDEEPTIPGPGAYETKESFPKKGCKKSWQFMMPSHCSRIKNTKQIDPGPDYYRPIFAEKQSFIFNSESRWI
ncbi:hypothetical protein A3Q56_01660 [Intoshia linei]|uniref:Uncharacterized protein n=1 Tax=Intoshia linei TaxID=1819745 RepID=A0A177B8P7_9BILA|nr:hypothetical protein A3Q56_01660 [Intoshia linei]